MALPPGPSAPALIQTLQWLLDPEGSLERDLSTFGDFYTVHSSIFGTEVVVCRPETLKQVFTGDPEVFSAAKANTPLGVFLGERSMLLLDGSEHLRHRRLLLPAFHGERMHSYTETMRDMTARMTSGLYAGQTTQLYPIMQRITLEVILRNVLGLDEGPELTEVRDHLTRVLGRIQSPGGALMMIPGVRDYLAWLPPVRSVFRAAEETDAVLYKLIAKRRGELEERGGEPRSDVLSMLLEATDESGKKLTDVDLRDEIITLLVAGHETTAISLCWAFEEILRSPGEQDRLAAEAREVVGSEAITDAHLPKLKRLEGAIKEVLRMHPPTAAAGRRLMKPATIQGHDLPAGVMVALCFHLTHQLPDLYPDPKTFKPERFIDKKTDPYEWLPFGGGSRRCVGLAFAMHEIKVVLATLLLRFRMRLTKNGPAKAGLRSLLYAPKGGTEVVIESVIEAPRRMAAAS